ncbi:hypothetical protein ACFVVU_23720 [Kitasatospora sp. NPDC057965]|uniref:hypothetical protein n=1 Tax=Kitasatospora sp. NPDC057965 TaxID=3346291 RepID=UPI0036DE71A9
MPSDPLWQPTLGYDELELRRMDGAFVMGDGTAQGVRGGIRPGDGGFIVSLSGTTVNITAGVAVLTRAGQGAYRAQLPASTPGTLAAAHTTYSRIDLVYLRVWDTSVDGTGLRKADTVLLTGTPQSGPVAPDPGATEIYIPLATITVPPTGSGGTGAATVSSAVRRLTVAPGGILPLGQAADLAAAGLYAGQVRYNLSTGILEVWTGSAWKAINPPLAAAFTESAASWVTTSTTYTVGSPPLVTTCTVPPSGKVLALSQSQLYINTPGTYGYYGLHMTGSATTVIRTVGDATAARANYFTTEATATAPYIAIAYGQPGETLTAEWQARCSGGAGVGIESVYRNITLIPLAG